MNLLIILKKKFFKLKKFKINAQTHKRPNDSPLTIYYRYF